MEVGATRRLGAKALVFGLSGAQALAAIALLSITPGPWTPLRGGGLWAPIVALVGSYLAERYVFRLEFREQGAAFSLEEVVAGLLMVFVSPALALAVRLLGAAPAMTRGRHVPPQKLAFNLSLAGFHITAASFTIRSLTERTGPTDIAIVGGIAPILFALSLVTTSLTTVVIAIHEGELPRRLRRAVLDMWPLLLIASTLASTCMAPALVWPPLGLLALAPVAVLWRLLLLQGELAQRHRDLTAVHDLTRALGQHQAVPDLVIAAESEIQRLLRASRVTVVLLDSTVPREVPFGLRHPVTVEDQDWAWVFKSDGPAVVESLPTDGGDPPPPRVHLLAAPLRDRHGLMGALLVSDRMGASNRFSAGDLARMRPLTDQLALSLRKALLNQALEREATHDRLTGLPNRALFEHLVTEELSSGRPLAVFLLDLDRFKEVNDGLGHHVGDTLLQRFAERVMRVLGPGDVLARLAGDEFVLLSPGADLDSASALGNRVLLAVRRTFDLDDVSLAVSCSVGLALAPEDGTDATSLLHAADLAMYQAKARSSGLEHYVASDSDSAARLELLRDLRIAIGEQRLDVHYQPKVSLRTGIVQGAEALVRWDHPTRGQLDAETFIGLAEQTDLVHAITDYVVERGLMAVRGWHRRGWNLGVAVNVSARTLLNERLPDRIAHHLRAQGIAPDSLTLEITETSVMSDTTRALATLNRLRALGVRISVDDFGTGYASFTYLRRLPVTEIKIDRAFVVGMLTDRHDQIIVRSTIDLGHHLGLSVVAEGIEGDLVARKLHDLGCDLGQGRSFSSPLPLGEFEHWAATEGRLEDGTTTTGALATA